MTSYAALKPLSIEVTYIEMMTVKEVAKFLHLKETTVTHLASVGKLPGVKVGKSWQFNRTAVENLFHSAQYEIIAGLDRDSNNPKT